MPSLDDPEFLEALEKIFATRGDIKAIAEYQRKLYDSLSELNVSHRAVHEHVRNLTELSQRGHGTTETLVRAREDLEKLLRSLELAHGQTQQEVRRAMQELNQIQQEIRKVPRLESNLSRLEQALNSLSRTEELEERMNKDQEERIRREERMNKDQEDRIRREEQMNKDQEERIRRLESKR